MVPVGRKEHRRRLAKTTLSFLTYGRDNYDRANGGRAYYVLLHQLGPLRRQFEF
jgi:hypothetical protein